MTWLLNIAYGTLLLILSPVIIWRSVRHGRYRQGRRQKLLGMLPVSPPGRRVIWFHAVSVGEVVQLKKVVDAFRTHTDGKFHIVVTTSTDTGYDLAVNRFEDCTVAWFPLDFSWAVSTALNRVRPEMVVLMELELWPNFLKACNQADIRTALINARMSDRSFAGYSRLQRLIATTFRNFSVVAAQTPQYADRLVQLGCRRPSVSVTGSVKFDGVLTDRSNPETTELRQQFGLKDSDLVFIAGSTQEPEEQVAFSVWQALRPQWPNLRLIVVPRHKERFDEVAEQLRRPNTPLYRRSAGSPADVAPPDAVILLDTIGELSACWGLADIAFVGGSFGSRGGQNMLEPAAFGAAVMFGPNTWNFRDIVTRLMSHHAAIQLKSTSEMLKQVRKLLHDSADRRIIGDAAREVVLSQQGAIDRTVRLLADAVDTQQTKITSRSAA